MIIGINPIHYSCVTILIEIYNPDGLLVKIDTATYFRTPNNWLWTDTLTIKDQKNKFAKTFSVFPYLVA